MKLFIVKKGFGRNKTKEFFVVEVDGDTLGGFVTGPFENKEQAIDARDALRPLHNRQLLVIGGHLVAEDWNWEWDWRANDERLASEKHAGE